MGRLVTITFNGKPAQQDEIILEHDGVDYSFVFMTKRSFIGEVLIPPTSDTDGFLSARSFLATVNADYNQDNKWTVELNDNVVTMLSNDEGVGFSLIEDSTPKAVIDITKPIQLFQIDNVDVLAGSDCDHIKLEVTTSVQADEVLSPVQQIVTTNPFTIEIERRTPINKNNPNSPVSLYITQLQVRGLNVLIREETIPIPVKLLVSAVKVEVYNTPGGSTAQVHIDDSILDLQFALDNGQWQQEKVFSGIAEGSHTIFIKDQFGCSIQLEFGASSTKPSEPIIYVSEGLSNRFVPVVDFGICSPYPNEKNILSCNEDVPKPFKEVQVFQTCDILKIQIKSNYENNRVILRKLPTGNTNNKSMTKISDNIGQKDKRFAETIILDDDGTLGVYFLSGDLYDYDSGAVIGDYTLNGGLPIWGKKGNFMAFDFSPQPDVWLEIKDVVWSEEVHALVLVLGDLGVQYINGLNVKSVFNLEEYEVYEQDFDLYSATGRQQITIESQDFAFGEAKFISEEFEVKEEWKDTKFIQYWNKYNNDIFYSSGIVNQLRMAVEVITGEFESNTDDQRTDDKVKLINEQMYQLNTFKFALMTTGMMRKIVIALSNTHVFINDMRYVKSEIEVEKVSENSNLYLVTAKMIMVNEIFSTGQFTQGGIDVEVPNLIKNDNTSYVKYS